MHYDPIKKVFGDVARKSTLFRRVFYMLLDIMFLRAWYVKRALRTLLDGRNQAFTLFDAGSGFGQYSYFLARRYARASIHAVDVKDEQIADCSGFFARCGLGNISFGVEDLTQPVHTDEFDVILSVDVMEHIQDDVQVFKNFHRALKTGGTVLINTPSNLGGSDAHDDEDESFIGEHARNGYGADEITEKLRQANLRVTGISYTYGPIGMAAWRLGIKYPMQLLNASKAFFIVLPLYYAATLWLTLALMYLDYAGTNTTGAGLLVTAQKG
jgi:cyclopropane fatty-acyl-phospholipid synthase-like methyltransferase